MTIQTYPLYGDQSVVVYKKAGSYEKVVTSKKVRSKAGAVLRIIQSGISETFEKRRQRKEMTVKNLANKNAYLQLGLEYIRDFTSPDKATAEAQLKHLQNFADEFLQNVEGM